MNVSKKRREKVPVEMQIPARDLMRVLCLDDLVRRPAKTTIHNGETSKESKR